MTNSLTKLEHSETEIEQTNNFQNSTKLTHHLGHHVHLKVGFHVGQHVHPHVSHHVDLLEHPHLAHIRIMAYELGLQISKIS